MRLGLPTPPKKLGGKARREQRRQEALARESRVSTKAEGSSPVVPEGGASRSVRPRSEDEASRGKS